MSGPSKVAMRSLLRSKGHLGKEATKFQFDITIDKLLGLHTGPHTIKWTRGAKVAYTKPFQIERKTIKTLQVGQKLSLLCTLYRSKSSATNATYDPKDSKLSLVSLKDGKKNEKTIGKLHFNIAEYAGVPSAEASVKFKLSNKVLVEVTITCTFVKLSQGTASSVGSGLSGMTASSGEPENLNEDDVRNDDFGEDQSDDSANGLEELFSPMTPEPKRPFEVAKDYFETNSESEFRAKAENANLRQVDRKISSIHTDREQAKDAIDAPNNKEMPSGNISSSRSIVSPRGKAKVTALGSDNENLRQELTDSKNELRRVKELHKIGEEVILELRQSLSKKEVDLRSTRNKQNEALKQKINEMNMELADVESRAVKNSENYEERLKALHIQVQSMREANHTLEAELIVMRKEQDSLGNEAHAKEHSSSEVRIEDQLKSLQTECDTTRSKLSSESAKSRRLEEKCQDLKDETSRLTSKLHAHEAHSQTVKKTYDDLASQYSQLREQHVMLQQELQALRDESADDSTQTSGSDADSEVPRAGLRGTKGGKRVCYNGEKKVNGEKEALHISLSNANSKLAKLKMEKAESERERQGVSAELEKTKERLERSQAESGQRSKECENLKAKYFQVCEELEDSDRKSNDMKRKLADLEKSYAEAIPPPNHVQFATTELSGEVSSAVQQKITRVFAAALEANKTIQRMKVDLQEAYDREEAQEKEIRRLKAVIDEITPKIQKAFERESSRRMALEDKLKKANDRSVTAELSLGDLIEKEVAYRDEITNLERAVEHLQKQTEVAKDTNKSALLACRSELKLKEQEIRTSADRVASLERELSSKRDIAENLSSKVRELEIESEIIRKQAFHEVELAKEASRQAEVCSTDNSLQAVRYKEEIESLNVVTQNLREELGNSLRTAEEEARNAQREAKESRKLREEETAKQRDFQQEIQRQRGIIDALQNELQEAAESNRKASEEAGKEAQRVLLLVEAKEKAERTTKEAKSREEGLEEKVSELSNRIELLNSTLEESTLRNESGIEKATKKLNDKEELLAKATQREEEFKQKIAEQEFRVSNLQEELNRELKRCIELSSDQDKGELERNSMSIKLSEKDEQVNLKQQTINMMKHWKEELEDELSTLKEKLSESQQNVASLRSELSDSQNKLVALMAASAADSSRTTSELEGAKTREEAYRDDINKKNELIEELTSKLTEAVGKHATDSAIAHAELSEALSREETYQEEIKRLNQAREDLEEEVIKSKSSNAFSSAELQADLSEALSREETYQLELKRLKGVISDLEMKLEDATHNMQIISEEKSRGGALDSVDKNSVGMRANKAMAEVLGIGDSLSSSNIRKLDVFEKITDARLLEMLVETKMQLALAEEEKLQLEHLIRRIRDGDKHVQDKLAQQAAKLEIKLTKANQMIDSMQDNRSSEKSKQGTGSSGSGRLERERSIMKGNQLQFFRESTKTSKARTTTADNRKGKKDSKSSRLEAPKDEWDLGDDSHDGGQSHERSGSGDSSFSTGSSDMER